MSWTGDLGGDPATPAGASVTPPAPRYLGTGRSTRGVALLGPENSGIAKDPSWIIR